MAARGGGRSLYRTFQAGPRWILPLRRKPTTVEYSQPSSPTLTAISALLGYVNGN